MDSVSGVGVLDKAIRVLGLIAERGPLGLAELQAESALPRATAHRLVVALEHHGFVRRHGDGRFALGLGLIALGQAAAASFPLADVARPTLVGLRDRTGESVQLFVREGDDRRCVVSLQSPHGLRWIVPDGAVLPLALGSAGRVLTGATGRQGWIESVEEREPGVASVSAPVLDRSGHVVAAVSVRGPVERLGRAPGARFGPDVRAAAGRIAADAASAVPG